MNEEWKDINGYKGLYQVSNLGRVRSVRYNKERIMELSYSHGYLRVGLYKNNKLKSHSVHRLVAQAFLDNPDNLPCVNHKDECKTNNHVDNLEWCSHQYNNTYGTVIQRRTEKNAKTVYQYTMDGEFVKKWISMKEIELELGFHSTNISACCRGKRPMAYGYVWKYTN